MKKCEWLPVKVLKFELSQVGDVFLFQNVCELFCCCVSFTFGLIWGLKLPLFMSSAILLIFNKFLLVVDFKISDC